MKAIRFEVYGNPVALKRHSPRRYGGNYDPSEGDKADFLAKSMQYRPKKPFDGPVSLQVLAFFTRPKYHFGKRKGIPYIKPAHETGYHIVKPDADNLMKFIKDALTGVFWVDDCIVCDESIQKLYCGKDEAPRIEIVTYPME